MKTRLKRWLHPAPLPPKLIPAGRRVYAVGDIHGRADLFASLLDRIERDVRDRAAARVTLVILGDFIDRGPGSRAVVEALRAAQLASRDVVVLRGNHEDALAAAWRGDRAALRMWLEHGGDATLASFGLPERAWSDDPATQLRQVRATIPEAVIEWIESLPLQRRCGDYLFVHAGIRPGVPLDEQSAADMLWIREPFLRSTADHGVVVVHGHSAVAGEAEILSNRINMDTGAYQSGRLSAVGLEDAGRWIVAAVGEGAA